jgi:alpha-tubulin suppressor-like RCC1 family protein
MNRFKNRNRSGFSLLIVLTVLFSFAALFPLVYLQTDDNFKRSQQVTTHAQIHWATTGETQRAHLEAARRTYSSPPAMTTFTHLATYTLPPGDYRLVPFTIQIQTTVASDPARSDEWDVTQNILLLENAAGSDFATPSTRVFPLVTPIVTFELLDDDKIIATFSREMGPAMLNPLNFTISGPGKGTLGVSPTSVTLIGDPADPFASHTYLLTWDTGARIDGQPINVTVAYAGDFQGNPWRGLTGTALEPPATTNTGMWKMVVSGTLHTLALKKDGTVWAWGNNTYGQLGDGTTISRSTPVKVSGLSNIIAIARGVEHSMALSVTGTVYVWGRNNLNQLGDGTTVNRPHPQAVSGLADIIAISGGLGHSLALRGDGKVWAWGDNTSGQIGNGSTVAQPTPLELSGVLIEKVIAISAGYDHSLALRADGVAFAWGRNAEGQLGIGNKGVKRSPTEVIDLGNPSNPLPDVVEISAGDTHSLFRLTNGKVRACGNNASGQIGDNSTTERTRPVEVTGLSNVIAIQAATDFSTALKSDGTLWCWGYNVDGQLGNGLTGNLAVPTQVGGLNNVIGFSGGSQHQAVVTAGGDILTWGANGSYQLGNGTNISRLQSGPISPIPADTSIRWKIVKSGGFHTIALKTDGTVWAWGVNTNGQLGDGTTTNRSIPVQVKNLSQVVAIACGNEHSLAIKADGTVWCWGKNEYGQIGDGTTMNRNEPVQVIRSTGLSNVIGISGGAFHSLALRADGMAYAWGFNAYGQLGRINTDPSDSPIPVNIDQVTSLAAGGNFSLARKSDGTLWGWGGNFIGQLGDGTTTPSRPTPFLNTSLSTIVKISAGSGHSLALTLFDKTLRGWGLNASGQLGDGTIAMRTLPIVVPGLPFGKEICCGPQHSLLLTPAGKLWAWGANDFSQLGDGTTNNLKSPRLIPELTAMLGMSGGSRHSLALTAAGVCWAWGDSADGKLGDGTIIKRFLPSAPEDVVFPMMVSTAGNEMNTLSLQIRIRNVATTLDVSTTVPCGIPPGTDRPWNKSSLVTISDGIVLIFGEGLSFETVVPFDKLRFSQVLPTAAIVEIFDLDRNIVVTSKTIP